MKLPRDISASDLIGLLKVFGYTIVRQTGSHIRLTTMQNGEHHLTIPRHDPLRVGTLAALLSETAVYLGLSRDEFLKQLFE
jgi:predicted RNA binding protein YcfA (HicA-like mRNA interferase family)